MKKIITFIISSSLLFCGGTIYFGVDALTKYKYHSDFLDINTDNSIETGSIFIGYDYPVYKKDKFILDIGLSVFTPSLYISSENINEDIPEEGYIPEESYSNEGIYSLYIKPRFNVGKQIDLWTNFGYAYGKPKSNSSEYISLDTGLSYGIGLTLKPYDNIGVTLRYSIFDSSVDMSKYQNGIYDFTSSSSAVIDLKLIRVGFDISYTF